MVDIFLSRKIISFQRIECNFFFSNLFSCINVLTKYCFLLFAGTIFKAHKLILAACSKNFADLFEAAPTNGGSIYVILEATSAANMSALLEFMYKGEVHVSQESLSSFLKAAESLQVVSQKKLYFRIRINELFFVNLGKRFIS